MDIAMEETLRCGRPGYEKLLQDFSPDDCGDCSGVIKEVKGHISFSARNG
jgi:hypothetical protein